MDGTSFLVGLVAGARARAQARQGQMQAPTPQRLPDAEAHRLEVAANAQAVRPLRPPLPVSQRLRAVDESFEFGVPLGFGPLPPPVLERWVAETGPSLATASQLNADGMPMLISASDRGEADAGVERALWRLSTDLAPEMVSAAGARHLTVTYGPQAVLIGDAHAIWYAASGLESGAETRLWSALVVRGGRAVEITMNVQPALEETYLPILWTVLGTWVWLR